LHPCVAALSNRQHSRTTWHCVSSLSPSSRLRPHPAAHSIMCPAQIATGHASGVESRAVDFLHTRAAVLRNHLLQSEGRLFLFAQASLPLAVSLY
jgi:hypothetical protein